MALEPYPARVLRSWILEQGASLDRQSGSHQFYRLPNGRELACPDPGSNHPVTTLVAKRNADICGLSLMELRTQLGFHAAKRKAGRGWPPRVRQPVAKGYAEQLRRLQLAAGTCLESGILPEQRDFMVRNLPSVLATMERIAGAQHHR